MYYSLIEDQAISQSYTVKNAVELLDVPPRINSLMMKNYNSHVKILFSYTHVLFFNSIIE
jgi:hypothetical protein